MRNSQPAATIREETLRQLPEGQSAVFSTPLLSTKECGKVRVGTDIFCGYNELKTRLGDQHKRTVDARQRVAKLYDEWNQPDQARQFR